MLPENLAGTLPQFAVTDHLNRPAHPDAIRAHSLERLVALNAERAAEEKAGLVRWLRPEFQAPDYVPVEQTDLDYGEAAAPAAKALAWPAALPEQVIAVAGIVQRASVPVAANDVARAFKGKRGTSVAPVLDALASMGQLRKLQDGRYAG